MNASQIPLPGSVKLPYIVYHSQLQHIIFAI